MRLAQLTAKGGKYIFQRCPTCNGTCVEERPLKHGPPFKIEQPCTDCYGTGTICVGKVRENVR